MRLCQKSYDTPFILLIYSRTEDGSTHTNHRAAVLDGNMIVVTHTPAALAEGIIIGEILCLYLIEEPGSLIKLAGQSAAHHRY